MKDVCGRNTNIETKFMMALEEK